MSETDSTPHAGQGTAEAIGGRSFVSLVVTQFLGAFNDNYFKQLMLLLAVDASRRDEGDYQQTLAQAVFAISFLLFSGLAGDFADRWSKTPIIRLAKVAELLVMLLGLLAFITGSWVFLLVTLFFMGTQSAFFGPAKYGILPQMLVPRSLSLANGIVLMTTFVAIILGMSSAGYLKDRFGETLWMPQLAAIAIAVVGCIAALGIRYQPAVRPDLVVRRHPFGRLLETLRTIWSDRGFRWIVLANAYFWFLGSVVLLWINRLGKKVLELDDTGTSTLAVMVSIGIASGSLLGGILSRQRLRLGLSLVGLAALTACLATLVWTHQNETAARGTLLFLGVSGGVFTVPLQTFVQRYPPVELKGRVVAANNFVSWVGIVLSSGYYGAATSFLSMGAIAGSLAVLTAVFGIAFWAITRRNLSRDL